MSATLQGALQVNRVLLEFSQQSCEVVTIIIINLVKVFNILFRVIHIDIILNTQIVRQGILF